MSLVGSTPIRSRHHFANLLLIVDRETGSYRLMMLVRRLKLGGRIIIGNGPIAR
jgi:hypothetical protein